MTNPVTEDSMVETEDSPALAVQNVTKSFGPGPAVLSQVSLTVHQGEFVAILGPSGCGKTTLLRIIQGLESASEGEVLTGENSSKQARMSYVFQKASLLPWFTVRENVAFGLKLRSGRNIYASRQERDDAVDELLELTGLSSYARYYPSQISGGMQQRTNVARALAVRPDVLLLDEPFSALDAMTRERLQIDVSRILGELGATGILVTHDIKEAVFLSDRVTLMSAGPGRVKETVSVPFARPRDQELQRSPELTTLERDIWRTLQG